MAEWIRFTGLISSSLAVIQVLWGSWMVPLVDEDNLGCYHSSVLNVGLADAKPDTRPFQVTLQASALLTSVITMITVITVSTRELTPNKNPLIRGGFVLFCIAVNFLNIKNSLRVKQVCVRICRFCSKSDLHFWILQHILYLVHPLIHEIHTESAPCAWIWQLPWDTGTSDLEFLGRKNLNPFILQELRNTQCVCGF